MEPKRRGIIFWICATILTLLWVSPIIASFFTSVKTLDELNQGLFWTLPETFAWHNYYDVFISGGFAKYFINTFIITVPSVLGVLFLASMNGYALAKLRFKGREKLLLMYIASMLLPFQILLIPVYYLSNILHTYDTQIGLIVFHVAFQLGFSSFFMRNFIKTVPHGIIEAARIDGCSEFKIYFQIVLPIMKPALAALGTLLFTWIWNDYLMALVLVQSDSLKPITTGLASLKGQWIASYHLQSAGALVAAIPPVIIFALLQKHFIRGLTMGSGK